MKDLPPGFIWYAHRVSYGETDAMGVVYYGNYMHLFERTRNELMRTTGMSYAEVERRGIFLPVRQADCRYRIPLRYDDLAWIKGGISEWGRASVVFSYEIYNETKDRLHATGSTQHATVDASGRPVPIPTWLREIF
ncbi:MAG: acyl-CoA thioesterase [Deltaproteobacteria bacterium]|jgi:acyl-CoA thioester hydrolase|nr:acyl-CoA thioesterase [Deltaproteobacteria bacterium]